MEVEKPKEEEQKEDCASNQQTSTDACQSKRPNQALYVPKQRRQAAKDKTPTQGEDKPRPKPRYTDKARKNAKNRKDKANTAAAAAAAGGADAQSCDVREERLQNGQEEAEASSQQEPESPQDEQEDSWETLFNDEGDCLDPHLLEEVRAACGF